MERLYHATEIHHYLSELNIKFKIALRWGKIGNLKKIYIDELEAENYPKNKQPILRQPNFTPSSCPSCKRNIYSEFDKGYFCQNCVYIVNIQKHQVDKKVRRQDNYFSTRMPYAKEKTRETYYSMVITTNNSTPEKIEKLQSLKGKTKLEFYKKTIIYYDELNIRRQSGNFQFQKNSFSKNVQGIGKTYHEVLLLMKFLQTKPQIKNMKINSFDL